MSIENQLPQDGLAHQKRLLDRAERFAGVGSWEWDVEADCWTCSDNWYRIHGLAPRSLSVDELMHLAHPDDHAAIRQAFEDAMHRGRPYDIQHRIVRLDTGEVRWLHSFGELITDGESKHRMLIGAAQDITEDKRSEETLRAAEERYRTIANYTYDWESWVGTDGRLKWISPSVERVTGYTADECMAMPDFPWRLVHPDDREEAIAAYRDASRAVPFNNFEFRILCKDGTIKWGSVVAQPVYDSLGRPLGHRSNIREITDHRLAVEALRASEEQFRAIFQLAAVGMAQADPQSGRFTRVNERMCEITGYTADELLSMSVPQITHPEDRDRDWSLLQRVVRGEAADYRMEKRYVRKDGSTAWVNVNVTVLHDPEGRPLRTVAAVEDITDRKRREAERELLESELRQSQKLEAVGQLASGVAHDFNNLLTVICGHAEVALEAIGPDHPIAGSLNTILHAAAQAGGVTQSLLTFSRKVEGHVEPIAPDSVVEEAVRLLQRLLPRTIELKVESPPEPGLWVMADRVQLKQVILNLAINARDAMPEGGRLSITCRSETGRQLPGIVGEATALRIEVTDTGAGMPPEVVDRVFEPFFTTKPRGQGTGLGLSIVHGIVKKFGGDIEVCSEVGKGSMFTVILPCVSGMPEGRAAPAARPAPCGRGERVLLADDNPQLLELLSGALTAGGYTVLAACDGEHLLELWARERDRIDIVVLDNDMPRRTGLDSLGEIRRTGSDVPALIITGTTQLQDQQSLDPHTGLLRKPFQVRELGEQIRRILDGRRRG